MAEKEYFNRLIESLRLCVKYGKAQDALENAEQAADAIEELSKPKWIPVKERLPEENDRYLTVSIEPWFGTTLVDTMRWSGVWMYDGRQTEATVTHWMPLPQPPKEET